MEIPYISKNPYSAEIYNIFEFETSGSILEKIVIANDASKNWKKISFEQRATRFKVLADLLDKRARELAVLITEEMGKPISQSIAEIKKSALVCNYYAANAEKFLIPELVFEEDRQIGKVFYEPMGLVLQIMPWNFPFWQVFRCAAATIMAGNVIMLKHAPNVPRCSEAIVQLFELAGFGKGIFQHIYASNSDIEKVLANDFIKALALTGSVKAGSTVGQIAAKNIKPSILELGGSDAFIVLGDANLELAAKTAVQSRFGNNGQTCIAAKRFIVLDSVADKFLNLLKNEILALKQGNPMDQTVDLSVMARADLAAELQFQVDKSISAGASVVLQGAYYEKGSTLFSPMILTDIPQNCPAYKEELFGPVLSFFKVKNIEEAINLANDSQFGLGASIWTSDKEKALEIATSLEVGAVSINQLMRSMPAMPFGGIKKSGFGRELGKEGLRAFMNVKSVMY
jgi:succinate-semialdehyde dehydrogenase/glutarate-semialdehyde dehydrogenase